MNNKRIAIIGGGLSGLYAAYLLEQKGFSDYILLEASDRLGGRIQSVSVETEPGVNQFDLGPTWFWPALQPELDGLINKLGLACFAQYEDGNMLIERSADQLPIRTQGYPSSPPSMRLKGGMGSLIRALQSNLHPDRLLLSAQVHRIMNHADQLEIHYQHDTERSISKPLFVDHIFLALPPRIATQQIEFIPALPDVLVKKWRETATWMAPHAKYLALFNNPFWRKDGLSGSARSMLGPMVEIHDASMPGGQAALFGFIGIPATIRKGIDRDLLLHHCRKQMTRLFGPNASAPVAEYLKDWANEPLTSTMLDVNGPAEHSIAPDITAADGPWKGRITGIGSEWSRQFPGYLAGAVDATKEGISNHLFT
jgi:monoamine oxidase